MRFVVLMMMLVGVLFSAQQRQIIIGSFSIESNALFYSIAVQKKINEEDRLKALVEKYSLNIEYKKIGAYNVVTIYPFENYSSLFEAIGSFKHYYPKAYSIRYPAFSSAVEVEEVVEIEEVEESRERVVEENIEENIENDVEKELIIEEVSTPLSPEIKYEPKALKKFEPSQNSMTDLILLIALLLVVIGFVIYKLKMKKKVIEV